MDGINMLDVVTQFGLPTAICGWMFWRDWKREENRRIDRKEKEEAERELERERIEATKENTTVMSRLATLIETMVK